MKSLKMFKNLLIEDLKSRLWVVFLVWYILGMLCLLLATKASIPPGEPRSLYVGPGNTSFFYASLLIGFVCGAAGFSYLLSDKKADLLFSLPFSRSQLFSASYLNSFFIFAVPYIFCKILFLRISVSMGYTKYSEAAAGMGWGCIIVILGYLFILNLVILAVLLAQNWGYALGIALLLLFFPRFVIYVINQVLNTFFLSYYKSEILTKLLEHLDPIMLYRKAAGLEEYADLFNWSVKPHLSYILVLAIYTIIFSIVNYLIFCSHPVERNGRMLTFKISEHILRYFCIVPAVIWIVCKLQALALHGSSIVLAAIGILFGTLVMHGMINIILSFNAKRIAAERIKLLIEIFCISVLFCALWGTGRVKTKMPELQEIDSMAIAFLPIDSGNDADTVLEQMQLEGACMERAFNWVKGNRTDEVSDSYEVLIKYEKKNGISQYRRYYIDGTAINDFNNIYQSEMYKKGVYPVLMLDSLHNYDIEWSNGMESYVLDLNEQEKQTLWNAYKEDLIRLSIQDIKNMVPIGRLTFKSTKGRDDRTGYIYANFTGTINQLESYGIEAEKSISDYQIIKVIAEHYKVTYELLYSCKAIDWQNVITDKEAIEELAPGIFCEEFCVDNELNEKNKLLHLIVYYRDSAGRTFRTVNCRTGADPGDNEILKKFMYRQKADN